MRWYELLSQKSLFAFIQINEAWLHVIKECGRSHNNVRQVRTVRINMNEGDSEVVVTND